MTQVIQQRKTSYCPAAADPREPLPAAEQIVGLTDAAFPFAVLLTVPKKQKCRNHFCDFFFFLGKSALNTFPLAVIHG